MASKHDGDAAALPGEATEWRWALAVFLLLDLALFAPVLLSGADRGLGWADGDLPRMFVPWRLWAKQRLLAGELPLWNPHIFAGLPYLAGFQGAIFYPPNALYLLPLGMAISLSRFLHTLLGQFGAWMLGREAGAAHPGPILTGIAFSLCAQSTYRIYGGHVCFLDGYAWMPWVVVGVLRVLREPSKGTFARATAASGMLLLSGYPQLFYLTWFAIAVVAGVGALLSETPAARLGRLAAITLGIGALTALLGAASLVPALELLSDSNRAGFDPRFVSMISLAPENLLTFLMPRFFGDDLTIPYWGQAFIPECIFYVGIVPLVLAVRSARRKSRETVLPWLVLLEICLLMALGPRTPFFLPLARVLPGMGMFRGPAKFMWIFGLGMSVLAGLGMATVGEKRQAASAPGAPRKVTLRLAAGLAFALGLVALGAGCGAETLVPWMARYQKCGERFAELAPVKVETTRLAMGRMALEGWRCGLLLALTFALLGAASSGRLAVPRAAMLLAMLAGIDLVALGLPCMTTFPLQRCRLSPALVEYLQSQPDGPWRASFWDRIDQNRAMSAGLETLDGYEGILPRPTSDFYDAMEHRPGETRLPERQTEPCAGTRLLNQRFYIYKAGQSVVHPGVRKLGRVGDVDVYVDPPTRPRAFLTRDYEVLPSRGAILERLREPAFRPDGPVLLEEKPGFDATAGGGSSGQVTFESRRPEDVVLRALAREPCLLVLSETHYRSWRALVDGQPVPILRAWGLVRAVALPAGEHRVEFRFDGTIVLAGIAVSALAWVVLLVALAVL